MTNYIKQLESKVKDCKNTNTIFDTRKYVLLKDAKEVLVKALNIPVVSGSESCSIRIFKLECLTEDGDMETNGYYKTRKAAELKKAELDKYPMNLKYGIKQQIVEIDLED